jgi:hypothetical protein
MSACVVPIAVPAGILLVFWLGYICIDRFRWSVKRVWHRFGAVFKIFFPLGTSVWAMTLYFGMILNFFRGTDWSLSHPRCTPLFWDVQMFLKENPGSSALHKYERGTSLVMLCTDVDPDALSNYSSIEKGYLTVKTSYLKTLYQCTRDESALPFFARGSCSVTYYDKKKGANDQPPPKAKSCADLILNTPPKFNGFAYVSQCYDYSTNGCNGYDLKFEEIDHAIGPCHLQYVYPLEHFVQRLNDLDIAFMTIFLVNLFQCLSLFIFYFGGAKKGCLADCVDRCCCTNRIECCQYALQLPCCEAFVLMKMAFETCDDKLKLTKQRPPPLFFILGLCFSVVEAIGIPIATLNGAYCPFCSYKTEWAFLCCSAYGILNKIHEYVRGPSNKVEPAPPRSFEAVRDDVTFDASCCSHLTAVCCLRTHLRQIRHICCSGKRRRCACSGTRDCGC